MKSVLGLEQKENEIKVVKLNSVPEWKIVEAIKRGIVVKVKNGTGSERELTANGRGDLCYLEGKNKKLMTDTSGWMIEDDLAREIQGGGLKGGATGSLDCGSGGSGGTINVERMSSAEKLKAILAVLSGETAPKPSGCSDMGIDDPFDYSLFELELDTALRSYPTGDLLRVSYMIGLMRQYGVILQAVYKMDSYKFLVTTSFSEERMAKVFTDLIRKHRLNLKVAQVDRKVHFLFYDLSVQQIMNLEKLKNLKVQIDWGKGGNVTNYHGGAHIPPAGANTGGSSGRSIP